MIANNNPTAEVGMGDVARLRPELLRYCELLCGSRHDAEDLAQTALLRALPLLRGKGHANVPALLRRIAKNAHIDDVRKQRHRVLCTPEEMADLVAAHQSVDPLELSSALELLLLRLTPQQRAVVLLCDAFACTDAEAAVSQVGLTVRLSATCRLTRSASC